MTEALLRTGKHTVTALARAGSQSKLPEGVIEKTTDYSKPETIVEALKGQHALVITLGSRHPMKSIYSSSTQPAMLVFPGFYRMNGVQTQQMKI
jgi:uncharacterized protein YbjT (DUF2867 family)